MAAAFSMQPKQNMWLLGHCTTRRASSLRHMPQESSSLYSCTVSKLTSALRLFAMAGAALHWPMYLLWHAFNSPFVTNCECECESAGCQKQMLSFMLRKSSNLCQQQFDSDICQLEPVVQDFDCIWISEASARSTARSARLPLTPRLTCLKLFYTL